MHAHAGTVLIVDLMNAAAFLPGGEAQCQRQFRVHAPGFAADVEVRHEFRRRRQIVVRHRRWTLDDGSVEDDYCEYRMLFPAELAHRLRQFGFEVVDMFDNKACRDTPLTGVTLYVVAVRRDAG
jgi:hypothetical protein